MLGSRSPNPRDHEAIHSVLPQPLQISPTGILTATGPASSDSRPAGISLASGQSTSFTVPYKVTGAGIANVSDSITWLNSPPTSGGGPALGS